MHWDLSLYKCIQYWMKYHNKNTTTNNCCKVCNVKSICHATDPQADNYF